MKKSRLLTMILMAALTVCAAAGCGGGAAPAESSAAAAPETAAVTAAAAETQPAAETPAETAAAETMAAAETQAAPEAEAEAAPEAEAAAEATASNAEAAVEATASNVEEAAAEATASNAEEAAAEATASNAEAVAEATPSNAEAAAEGTEMEADAEEKGGKKAILAVSFGTSYNDSRNITIGAIEGALREAFPDYDVRRAFTSQVIIDKLEDRDNIKIDNVEEALERLAADGVTELVVQPTHLMSGFEFIEIENELVKHKDDFESIVLGNPLLNSEEDYEAVIQAISAKTAKYDDGNTAVVFMGHGTEAESNGVYAFLQEMIREDGIEDLYIGTVEAKPSIDDVREMLEEKKYDRVVLEPLMVVAGDHANNDMAGDDPDSWKSILEKDGYEVVCVLEGLGQSYDIQSIYVKHAAEAIEVLAAAEAEAAEEETAEAEAAEEEAAASAGAAAVAAGSDGTAVLEAADAVTETGIVRGTAGEEEAAEEEAEAAEPEEDKKKEAEAEEEAEAEAGEAEAAEGTGAEAAEETEAEAEVTEEAKAEAEAEEGAEEPARKAILVVSFGTSYNESRNKTIGAIEAALMEAFPEYSVRRAFTSQIIIDKLAERDGLKIDNVGEALDRLSADRFTELIVQPTHLMNGFEYMDIAKALEENKDRFGAVVLADPLLSSEDDLLAVVHAVAACTAAYDDGDTAIVFMGHGTGAESNRVYAELQETFKREGFKNYYIGTVEAEPSIDDIAAALKGKGYKKVVLQPMMVVAGDHATNDMAGDEADSWKSILEAEGYEVTCVLEGLGQNFAIQQIYVEHTDAAIDALE